MIHFTLGPVEMYERTKAAGALQNPYFRVPEFSSFIQETHVMLKEFLNVPASHHIMFLAGSGTGAMEATLLNCFVSDDRVLIINGGDFAQYFVRLCEYQNISYDTVDISFGETLTEELLSPYEGKNYTALLVNIHETSTGQLYDKGILRDFCRRNNMYYIVDAISSVCADELDIAKYNMDAVILSSQKGFACSPGLGIVILSDRLYDHRVANHKICSFYYDFNTYVKNMERFQTPYTPPIGILYQLNDMLKYLLEIGSEQIVARTYRLADYFRKGVQSLGVRIMEFPLSNAMTPLYLTDISAFDVHRILKDKYNIMINPSGLLPDNLCRIGHLGNLHEKDYNMLISILQTVFGDLSNGK